MNLIEGNEYQFRVGFTMKLLFIASVEKFSYFDSFLNFEYFTSMANLDFQEL